MKNMVISSTPEQYQVMLDNYADILEKTNSQLGLWANPYGLMVGILTLLVAVGAIIISVILVRNSREQKEIQQEFFKEQERLIQERYDRDKKFAEESRVEAKKELDVLIKEKQEEFDSVGSEAKREIQNKIDELKKEKARIGARVVPSAGYDSGLCLSARWPQLMNTADSLKEQICNSCGRTFYHSDASSRENILNTLNFYDSLSNNGKRIYCSYCGAKNIAL